VYICCRSHGVLQTRGPVAKSDANNVQLTERGHWSVPVSSQDYVFIVFPCAVSSEAGLTFGSKCQHLMHSGKLNWTRLNWTELDRSVQFSSVYRCALNRRRAATTGDGRRRFLTVKNRRRPSTNLRRPSPVVAGFHPTTDTALIGRFTSVSRLWRTCDDRRFRRRIVAGRRRFNAQRETELNWTVPLSSVSRCALDLKIRQCPASFILTVASADLVL